MAPQQRASGTRVVLLFDDVLIGTEAGLKCLEGVNLEDVCFWGKDRRAPWLGEARRRGDRPYADRRLGTTSTSMSVPLSSLLLLLLLTAGLAFLFATILLSISCPTEAGPADNEEQPGYSKQQAYSEQHDAQSPT